jgi:hypothetical protein
VGLDRIRAYEGECEGEKEGGMRMILVVLLLVDSILILTRPCCYGCYRS